MKNLLLTTLMTLGLYSVMGQTQPIGNKNNTIEVQGNLKVLKDVHFPYVYTQTVSDTNLKPAVIDQFGKLWRSTSWPKSGGNVLVDLPLTKSGDTIGIGKSGRNNDGALYAADFAKFQDDSSLWKKNGATYQMRDPAFVVGMGRFPTYKLDVEGDIRFNGGLFNQYGKILHHGFGATGYNQSLYGGLSSGINAGSVAFDNTGWGAYTLRSVTGINNTATGVAAGYSITSGSWNSLYGRNAMVYGNGWYNSIFSAYPSGNTVNGWYNTTLGYAATLPLADSNYQLNIANMIRGRNGKIQIGTIADSAAMLTVNGSVKITDGTQAAGRVFTSDANGQGSWQDPPASGIAALADIGSSPNAQGATISGSTLTLQPASASFGGVLTAGAQTIAGAKTFNSDLIVNGITFGRGNLGTSTNTVGGFEAGATMTSGQNAIFGYQAGKGITGVVNTLYGYHAGVNMTAGAGGTFVGGFAGRDRTGGNYNIGIGYEALRSTGTGGQNIGIGRQTGRDLTTGFNNIMAGYLTGQTITDGSGNILIGNSLQTSSPSASNELNIGNWIKGTAGALTFPAYTGSITGTPVTNATFDANGNLIQSALPTASSLQAVTDIGATTTNRITSAGLTSTGSVVLSEITAPANPAANTLVSWAENRSGRTIWRFKGSQGLERTLGRDNVRVVRNTSGSTITKGSLVAVTGSTGQIANISLANAGSASTLAAGIAAEDISNNGFGFIMSLGEIGGLNTTGLAEGAELYLSTTNGQYTTTAPSYPNFRQVIGQVANEHASQGIISADIGAPFNPLATPLTTYSSTTGTITAADNIIQAIQKLNGNTLNDYRAANFIAGTHYLTPTGSATGLTGILTSQAGGTGVNNGGRTLAINTNSGSLSFTNASKTLSIANNLTLSGTDGSTLNIGAGGTLGTNAFNSTAYQPLATNLTSIGALANSAGYLYNNGSGGFVYQTPSGSGDVVKVGTPVDNQLGVWTGNGTIEGDPNLTYNASTNTLSLAGTDADIIIRGVTNEPPTPSANNLTVYARSVGGKMALKVKGASGLDSPLQPALYQNSVNIIAPNATTSISSLGGGVTSVGTISHPTPSTTTFGNVANFVTAGTANSTAGTGQVGAPLNTSGSIGSAGGFFVVMRLHWPDANYGTGSTGSRFFIGLISSTMASSVGADNPAGSRIGFAYSTNLSETDFMLTTKDGTTETRVSTGVPFSVDKLYDFYLFMPPGGTTLAWRIDNLSDGTVTEGTTSATLPAASTFMRAGFQIATLTNSARNIRMKKVYIETDY